MKFPIHDICNIFPVMSEEEFSSLKADIAIHGQREPAWTYHGEVIDGRNRVRACEELGITPTTREWDGSGSLVGFVVSLNLHRRHLTSGQRAACGTEIEERLAVEAKERHRKLSGTRSNPGEKQVPAILPEPIDRRLGEARNQAARVVGSSPRYIQDAKAIKAKAPELHEKVKSGAITLPQAKREIIRQERREALEVKAKAVEADPESRGPRRWEIVTGDCLAILRDVEPGSVRLAFADPPYNIGVDYGEGESADDFPANVYLEWCQSWVDAVSRVLASDGSFWVLICDEWADEFGCMLRRSGLHRRAWIKWYESFGVNCANNFNRCSRHLFYVVKDPRRFVFNPDAVSRPSDRQAKYGDRRADPNGKIWDDVWGINPSIPRLTGTASERIPDFPTQLPISLLSAVVGCSSDPGDLVIDPFNGSGTTGEACIRLGRRYLGMEKSATFADIARKRLLVAMGQISNATQEEA